MIHDVIVIGGSYAGLSAALQVARARRHVLVIDSGLRRNRFATTSHGFLGHDGRAAAEIAGTARAELLAYPTVALLHGSASSARETPTGFAIGLAAGGAPQQGKRLVLAVGVIDEIAPIPGLEERWGKHVFHCPYCHGYELGGGRIGVIATSPLSVHAALMLPDWGETTLFAQGFEPDAEQLRALERRGVEVERELVTAIEEKADICLRDGRVITVAGIFAQPRTRIASPLPAQLGCAVDEGPMGAYLRVDATKETTVAGVFACGDVATAAGTVGTAVGDGIRAGMGAHQSLIFR